MIRKIAQLSMLLVIAFVKMHAQTESGRKLDNSYIWNTDAKLNKQQYVAFRKTFSIDFEIQEASIKLFADNRYTLWVNGSFIDFGPGRFNPKHPRYDEFEITELLVKGENCISVLVHNIAIDKLDENVRSNRIMSHRPGLTAQVMLTSSAGKQSSKFTDSSWKTSNNTQFLKSPVSIASIHDNIDMSKEHNWHEITFNDSKWTNAVEISNKSWGILAKREIPRLLRDTIQPKQIVQWQSKAEQNNSIHDIVYPITMKAGDIVTIDVGEYVLAYTEIELDAQAKSVLEIDYASRFFETNRVPEFYAEVVPDRSKYPSRYKAKQGQQLFRSNDVYGYKYLVLRCKKGNFSINNIRLINRLYPYKVEGEFVSNDTMLNEIWNRSIRTIKLSSEDAYISSIGSERGQWVGDAIKVSYPIAASNFSTLEGSRSIYNDTRLLKQVLRHTAYSQLVNGRILADSPPSSSHDLSDKDFKAKPELKLNFDEYALLFMQAVYDFWKKEPSSHFVEEMWPYCVKLMDFYLQYQSEKGLFNATEYFFYGNPYLYKIGEYATINAFFYRSLRDMDEMAEHFGEDQEKYIKAANKLYDAYNHEFWLDSTKSYSAGIEEGKQVEATVHAAIAALYFDLVPVDKFSDVITYFIENHKEAELFPFKYIYIFDLIFRYPNELNALNPLDIIREKWACMLSYETGLTSEGFDDWPLFHDHRIGSVPAYLFSRYILGVKEGNDTIKISPQLFDLKKLNGAVCTNKGVIRLEFNTETPNEFAFTLFFDDEITAKKQLVIPLLNKSFSLTFSDGKSRKYKIKNETIVIDIDDSYIIGKVLFEE